MNAALAAIPPADPVQLAAYVPSCVRIHRHWVRTVTSYDGAGQPYAHQECISCSRDLDQILELEMPRDVGVAPDQSGRWTVFVKKDPSIFGHADEVRDAFSHFITVILARVVRRAGE